MGNLNCANPAHCDSSVLRCEQSRPADKWDEFAVEQKSDPKDMAKERRLICAELVSSESFYCKSLNDFFKFFAYPLDRRRNIRGIFRDAKKWDRYFGQLEAIKDFHLKILSKRFQQVRADDMDASEGGGDSKQAELDCTAATEVAEVLLSNAEQLRSLYVPYLKEVDRLHRDLKAEKKRPLFLNAFKAGSKGCGRRPDSMIGLPQTRIARYRIILLELSRNIPDEAGPRPNEDSESGRSPHDVIGEALQLVKGIYESIPEASG